MSDSDKKVVRIVEFLEGQKDLFAYEDTAMSQARFSHFLEELLDVIKEPITIEV